MANAMGYKMCNIPEFLMDTLEMAESISKSNTSLTEEPGFLEFIVLLHFILSIVNVSGSKYLQMIKESELDLSKTSNLFSSDFCGIRDELIFELFYQTGIRLSELIGLKDIDMKEQHIKVLGKRNEERLIPISKELAQSIRLFQDLKRKLHIESPKLFSRENGKDLYPAFVYRKINAILGSLTTSDKKSPHVLRHTFATHLLNRGTGLETLKDLLGHANLSATQVYTHNSFAQLTAVYAQAHPRGMQKSK